MIDHETAAMIELHDLRDPAFEHDDLDSSTCACGRVVRRPPNTTGDSCANCGGMTVRTGSCATCVECGTSGGCG